ncbi:MAG: DNA translocase FtsK, partial [Firmicutes bacterium]|nr:DNA translocase FtsK [Bacillota bacterium]
KGDMLYAPIGASRPVRIQGTFVSDKEVEDVVAFVKQNGAGSYDTDLTDMLSSSSSGNEIGTNGDDEIDEYLEEAIRLVVDKQKASISMMQRAFRIGFNRAARLMDALEKRGVVGPDEGSKPRQVLMTKEDWEAEA